MRKAQRVARVGGAIFGACLSGCVNQQTREIDWTGGVLFWSLIAGLAVLAAWAIGEALRS